MNLLACMGTLFNTICNGGTVILATRLNFQERSRHCTVLAVTPSILDVLDAPQSPADYPHLDRIFLGGETPSQQLLETWSAFNNVALWIAYGPTEATCAILSGQLRPSHKTGQFYPTQLGDCIPGSNVVLLDEEMGMIQGHDSEGEICIEGPCLTDGYWQDEERSRDRFIDYHGRRLYRTGDLGRFVVTDDGGTTVEFCGRRDRLTKIRGFLVNLELDVDAGLRRLDAEITSIFSVMIEKTLCTAIAPSSIDCRKLLASWRQAVPQYLVPDKIIALNDIPLTANGKVDPQQVARVLRDAMGSHKDMQNSKPDQAEPNGTVKPSGSPTVGQTIVEGIQQILKIPQNEVDLSQSAVFQGIHSLAAARLSTFCRQHGYAISVEAILTEPSMQSLIENSQYGEKDNAGNAAFVPSMAADTLASTHGPVTPLQQRMVLDSLVGDPRANCIEHISWYNTDDIGSLRTAWKTVVSCEPIFKTSLVQDDKHSDNVSQRLVGAGLFTWEEFTVTTYEAIEKNLRSLPTVTGLGSRFRVLHCVGAELPLHESIFIWAVHHALIDGYSASLVFGKVDKALKNQPFECSLPFTLAAHDIAQIREDTAPEAELFWQDQANKFPGAAGEPLIPEKFFDQKAYEFAEHVTFIDVDKERLRQTSQQAQATPAAIFYAAWAMLLASYTNSDTVAFGAVFSGRNLPFAWATSMIGPLLNILLLRCRIDRRTESASFVRDIHQAVQQLSRYQFADRHTDTPLFATTLTVQDAGLRPGTTAIHPLRTPHVRQSNLLPLTVFVETDGRLEFLYRTDKFSSGHVKDMADIFINLIGALLEPDQNLQYCIDRRFKHDMNQAILRSGNINSDAAQVPTVNRGHTLSSLFGKTAALFTGHIAVEKGLSSITYAALAHSAAQVANVVHQKTQPGDVVAIHADRSINWIIGIFGAMIANTVYCPLDASYAAQYREELLRRSDAGVFLVPTRAQIPKTDSRAAVIAIDDILSSDVEPLYPWRRQTPGDAAYLCFTSGSTGVPKGIRDMGHNALGAASLIFANLFLPDRCPLSASRSGRSP